MKLRHTAACAALSLSAFFASAQNAQIRAGLNLANVSTTANGRVNEANQLTTFQVGVIGDVKLGTSFLSLQPGLLYTGKGAKIQKGASGQSGYYKQTFNPMYLEVPLNLVVKLPVAPGTHFFAGAGPYVAVGVGGKVKTEGTNILGQTYSHQSDIQFSNDDPTTFNKEEGAGLGLVRRFDYGLNGTAGLETRSIVLGVNYGLGLAKLQSGSNSSQDNNNKNRVVSLTLGFKL